jgi:hypothetical protein
MPSRVVIDIKSEFKNLKFKMHHAVAVTLYDYRGRQMVLVTLQYSTVQATNDEGSLEMRVVPINR